MKVEQANKIVINFIEELSHELERGHSETLRQYLVAMGRFHRYSFNNLVLIRMQRPDATRVAGYRKWRQLGRQVKTGAKGIFILAPIVLENTSNDIHQEEERSCVALRFRVVYVFDIADTDGPPLPQLGATEGDPSGYTERLKEFVSQNGIQLEYSEEIYPAQGRYSPGRIVLLPHQSPAEEFATLVHEVAHARLMHLRTRRSKTTKCVRETEAEAVAYVVCEAIGLKANRAADYIQLWCGDKHTLAESLEHVQSASAEILRAIAPDC
jgi:antirestriction protein ArdC